MSQYVYNPNEFMSPSNDMNNFQQQPSHSNYKDDYNMRQSDMRQSDMRQSDMRQSDMRQSDIRQSDMRYPEMREPDMRYPEVREPDMREYDTYYPSKKRYENMSNKKKYNYEAFQDTTGFNYMSLIKKIIVYTILFLIMSHIKMNHLLCGFIPFLENNEIVCMVTKGFIMSCIIIILYPLL